MGTVHIIDHPLVQHKLSLMRSVQTGPKEFRELLEEISLLMTYEATRDFPLEEATIQTPAGPATGRFLAGKKVAVVPILRAGLAMLDGILKVLPTAKVGHVGIYHDAGEAAPVRYYCRLPEDVAEREAIVVGPMVATGRSVAEAVGLIKERGARGIRVMALVAAPEGLRQLLDRHPDVEVYLAAVDQGLDEHGSVVPGLGDVGDRLYGTR